MVKILDRYAFTEALRFFALSLLTFLTLFLIIDLVSNIDLFMKGGVKTGLTYLIGRLPLYAVRVIPIATLLSTMLTLSKFSSTNELTVVRALGISVYRFSIPLFVLALFVSLFSLSLQEFAVPKGLKAVEKVRVKKKKKRKVIPATGIWMKNSKGQFVFFWEFNPEEKRAKRVSVLKVKGYRPTGRIDAKEGKNERGTVWKLREGFVRNLEELRSSPFKEAEVDLGISAKEVKLSAVTPESMGLWELFLTAKRLERIGYRADYLWLELYSKVALSLLPVVVTLLGIPFGVYNPRNKKGYTALFAAALIVSMWIVISLFLSLGKSGVLPPSYAAFAPLFMFGALGLILLARVET